MPLTAKRAENKSVGKPRLLDLFCGGGGAARGYQHAGFHVTGVDNVPQPRYAGDEFILADALDFPLDGFDAIHASPPCQKFTVYGNNKKRVNRAEHPDHIPPTRWRLKASGVPWIMENVVGAPLWMHIQLCGTSLGLEVRRHRWFESSVMLFSLPCAHHLFTERKYPGSSNRPNGRTVANIGEWRVPLHEQMAAMQVDWVTSVAELSQMVPPAYTEFLGRQLMAQVEARAA